MPQRKYSDGHEHDFINLQFPLDYRVPDIQQTLYSAGICVVIKQCSGCGMVRAESFAMAGSRIFRISCLLISQPAMIVRTGADIKSALLHTGIAWIGTLAADALATAESSR